MSDASERDPIDPRGLIREAFAMPDISEADCRSIFFDWALGLPEDADALGAIDALLERHAAAADAHPMRRVLIESRVSPRRRRQRRRRAPPEGSTPEGSPPKSPPKSTTKTGGGVTDG